MNVVEFINHAEHIALHSRLQGTGTKTLRKNGLVSSLMVARRIPDAVVQGFYREDKRLIKLKDKPNGAYFEDYTPQLEIVKAFFRGEEVSV